MPKKVSVVLDDDLYMKILDYATRSGVKKVSTAIRVLVIKGLSEEESKCLKETLDHFDFVAKKIEDVAKRFGGEK